MTPLKKLSKDQIQKMLLSTIGFFLLLYVYFTFFLGPLTRSRASMEHQIVDLQQKIASSKTDLAKVANLEKAAGTATSHYAELQALTPEGAPVAWFPPQMKTFFADEHIDKAVARLASVANPKEPELVDWTYDSWSISLPDADYAVLGKAIADLENAQPLLSIDRLSIQGKPDQLQFQQIEIAATNIIRKK